MILLSASKVWLWVRRDGGIWSFLTWTKKHLSLHRHPEMSLEVVEKETLLILQESQYYFLLELDDAVSRWTFSGPDLLQRFWFVHLRLENGFSIFFGNTTLHWVFWSRIPTPQCLQPLCHPSKFPPRTERIQGPILVRRSLQIHEFLTGLSQR